MSDYRDTRGGAYNPITPFGNPQPPQVRDKETPHQKARMCVLSRYRGRMKDTHYPRDCEKARMGPLNKDTGRRPKKT